MKKVLLAALFSFFLFKSFPQVSRIDRYYARIDSLRLRLPDLADTARINCLDSLAIGFAFGWKYTDYDSVSKYAEPALAESRKINFKTGVYTSLFALSLNETRSDIASGKKHAEELVRISDDDSLSTMGKVCLTLCLEKQAKFDEALEVLNGVMNFHQKRNKTYSIESAFVHMSICYVALGNYEKAFYCERQLLELSRSAPDWQHKVFSRLSVADLYTQIGDYETAKYYFDEAATYLPATKVQTASFIRNYYSKRGSLYFHLNQFDSALYYFQTASATYPTATVYKIQIANVYVAKKNYDAAILLFDTVRKRTKQIGDKYSYIQTLSGLAETYFQKKDYKQALQFATETMKLAAAAEAKPILSDAYSLVYRIDSALGRTLEELNYFKKYIALQGSLISDKFKAKLFDYKRVADDKKKLAEIDALKTEKKISEQQLQIQKQQLRQKTLTKNALIAGISLIMLLSIIMVRNIYLKRKNEHLQNQQIQSQFQRNATELEMQALRAQMNPHFIFNCLSSINRFILKNETESASDYLTKFSRLIRMVLTNSQSSLVTLKEELEMLKLYLDMEQLRFKNAFDYNISCNDPIDAEIISIPPLVLQPFCENAIWHGLMHKDGPGKLDVIINAVGNILYCTISDNGIGRIKAAEFKNKSSEKQKSFGLKITSERLALFNDEHGSQSYKIEDLKDDNGNANGTKVILKIKYKDAVTELI